jgi:hypothetical protein
VKISDKEIILSSSEPKQVNVVFDPKPSESDVHTIDIVVTDTIAIDGAKIVESATIPIKFGEYEIIATDFDMATDSYSFKNWGIEFSTLDWKLTGNCYGMSETSLLYFDGSIERPNNRETTYKLTKDKPDNAKWNIRYHQWLGNNLLASLYIEDASEVIQYFLLEDHIKRRIPMLLLMQEIKPWEKDVKHAVVAYKIVKRGCIAICYHNFLSRFY